MMGGWRGSRFGSNAAYGPFSMMGYGVGSYGFLGPILMILWWVLIIAAIVTLVRWLSGRSLYGRGANALAILKERYAKGEISKKDFNERKKELL